MADLKYTVEVGVQQATRALDDLRRKVQQASDQFEEFNGKIVGFSAALAATLTAAGIAAGRFADQLNDTAAAFDTTTNNVLGLGQALALAGGQFDSVGRLYDTFARSLETANSGNLKTIELFERLGVSVEELGRLSQEELQRKVLASLSEIPDAAQRNALAIQLFGKALQGVDVRAFTQQLEEQREKYAQYEDQVKLAGDAFGRLDDLLTDLRVGAAVAFEPIFKAINNLNITLEDVIKGFKILTAVMIGLGSAAVLGAIVKVTKAMIALGEVVSKNKLVTIIGALVSVGAATATWLGLTKEVDAATDAIADKSEEIKKDSAETRRDQSAITELYTKQRQTLTDVTAAFDRQIRATQDRLDLELESLGLSEQQRKIRQEQAKIEEQTQAALLNLKQKYDALDENSRKKRLGDYERERAAIEANGQAALRNAEETIRLINQQTQAFQDQQRAFGAYTDARVRLFDRVAQVELAANTTFQNRISQEEKLNTIVAIRQRLLEAAAAADLSPEDLERVKLGIIDATTRVDLMNKSFEELDTVIGQNVITSRELTDEQARLASKVLESSRESIRSITQVGEAMARENERVRDYQRSFTTGWAEAYQRFADDATNAARQAERVFDRLTRGLEDAFVNFARTGRLSFRDMINGIVEDLLRSQIRQVLAQVLGMGGGRGSSGGILGSIGKIFGFASGGVVPGNRPILVGEQGPEIFMPPGQGTVIPNNQLGGAMVINYNISAVDARSFQELVARDPEFIYAVTERGRRGLPQGRR